MRLVSYHETSVLSNAATRSDPWLAFKDIWSLSDYANYWTNVAYASLNNGIYNPYMSTFNLPREMEYLMTSPNGNALCVTGPLSGNPPSAESNRQWWFALSKGQLCGAVFLPLLFAWESCCRNNFVLVGIDWKFVVCQCTLINISTLTPIHPPNPFSPQIHIYGCVTWWFAKHFDILRRALAYFVREQKIGGSSHNK